MEELKTVLKMENYIAEIKWILYFINIGQTHFMREYWLFHNVYMMREIPGERNNSIIVPIFKKRDKQNAQNYRRISLLHACNEL
jgi:hypothetical protein